MPIIVNLDVMLARRKMRSRELAEHIGITEQNISLLKSGKVLSPLPVRLCKPCWEFPKFTSKAQLQTCHQPQQPMAVNKLSPRGQRYRLQQKHSKSGS